MTGLTRRGWSLLGAAVGLLIGSRLLGTVELAMLGLAASALLAVSWAWTWRRRIDLGAARRLRPQRTVVGEEARVDLAVSNEGRHVTPQLAVADVFDGGRRAARFRLPPLPATEQAHAAYRVPTTRRGRFAVGPLVVTLTDPFGLSRRSFVACTPDELLVWPRVHPIGAPALGAGRASIRPGDPSALIGQGEEFFTLREYAVGDDLRQVHWRSTARADRVMIKQHEAHRQAHALVFLDVRPAGYDTASFERAVEATASIVFRLARLRRNVELVLSSGHVVRGGFELLLDRLAVVEPHGPDRVAGALGRHGDRAFAVLIAPTIDDTLAARAVDLARRGDPTVVVATRSTPPAIQGTRVVDASEIPFPAAWDTALTSWPIATSPRSPARR